MKVKVKTTDHQPMGRTQSLVDWLKETMALYLDDLNKQPTWLPTPLTMYPVSVSEVGFEPSTNMLTYDVTFTPVVPAAISLTINKDGSISYGKVEDSEVDQG